MASDLQIVQHAYLFIRQHGENAKAFALRTAEQLQSREDHENAECYVRIARAIDELKEAGEDKQIGLNIDQRITLWQAEIENNKITVERDRASVDRTRANNERFKIRTDYRSQQNTAMLDALIGFANGAIKSLVLLNGGAAVAVLAFLGHITASENPGTQVQSFQLVPALVAFAVGAALGALTAATAYLSQMFFYELRTQALKKRWGEALRRVSIVIVVLGYACFGYGIYKAAVVFSTNGSPSLL